MRARLVVIIFTAMLSSCATSRSANLLNERLSFETAESIFFQSKTQNEVTRRLGGPSDKSALPDNEELWNYDETGYQRLSIKFGKNKTLESVLWIPRHSEPESKLEGLLARYPNLKITPLETREVAPPHSISTETTYFDGKFMSFLQANYSKNIYAIGWSNEQSSRTPSARVPQKKVEF